jgi:acetyl esterase/lipase
MTDAVSSEDVTWANFDGEALLARVYRPSDRGRALRIAIVDVHGGAWNIGDRLSGAVYDRALATIGFTIVSIDFRRAPRFRHPVASRDVCAAVRWVRRSTDVLGAFDRIGLMGSSSGGHLALLAGTRPRGEEHRSTPYGDASVDFIAALWPVSDPFYRYRYAKRAGLAPLVAATEAYYGDENTMRAASVPRLIVAGEADSLPRLLVVQPGEDSNVPVEMTFDLVRAYQSRGGRVDYAYFPDEPHGFGQRPSPATDEMVSLIADFARRGGPVGA